MHLLDNLSGSDIYMPDPANGQTDPIDFLADIYSDAMGAAQQLQYKESCTCFSQAQFRTIAEGLEDRGNIVSYPV